MAVTSLLSTLRGRRAPAGPEPAGVPQIEYPSPLAELPDEPLPFEVKNTFINTAICQPSSLLGSSAFAPRVVRSCPGSKCAGAVGPEGCGGGEKEPGSPRSRSSSAGASTRASAAGEGVSPATAQDAPAGSRCSTPREEPSKEGVPEFVYPATEFSVRNTFIVTRTGQLPSMVDDAFEERRIRSCPSSGLGLPSNGANLSEVAARLTADDDEEFTPMPAVPSWCVEEDEEFTPAPAALRSRCEDESWDSFVPAPVPCWWAPADAVEEMAPECFLQPPAEGEEQWAPLSFVPPPPPLASPAVPGDAEVPMPSPAAAAAMADVSVPSLVTLVPPMGSPDVPTVGSLLHFQGACRPCAHAFTKGCASGVNCQFCHLCEPGELKRRQKDRRIQLARQQALDRRAEGSGTARGRRGGRRS